MSEERSGREGEEGHSGQSRDREQRLWAPGAQAHRTRAGAESGQGAGRVACHHRGSLRGACTTLRASSSWTESTGTSSPCSISPSSHRGAGNPRGEGMTSCRLRACSWFPAQRRVCPVRVWRGHPDSSAHVLGDPLTGRGVLGPKAGHSRRPRRPPAVSVAAAADGRERRLAGACHTQAFHFCSSFISQPGGSVRQTEKGGRSGSPRSMMNQWWPPDSLAGPPRPSRPPSGTKAVSSLQARRLSILWVYLTPELFV